MAEGFRLIDNHIIAAKVFDETSGQWRESTLDLDYCLSRDHAGGDHSYYAAARAPKSFTSPYLDHTTAIRWKLSEEVNHRESMGNTVTVELSGSEVHIRNEIYVPIFPNKIADSYIKLKEYIRCTKTGRMEWVHP